MSFLLKSHEAPQGPLSSSVSPVGIASPEQELSCLFKAISVREHPSFLRELGKRIFSDVLPGEDPISFQSAKFKGLLDGVGVKEFKLMRFFTEIEIFCVIQLAVVAIAGAGAGAGSGSADRESKKVKTLHPITETEMKEILEKVSRLEGVSVSWDDSSLARYMYETEPGFWKKLEGYCAGVHDFYKSLHRLLLSQLKQEIVRKDLVNIVIWDLGCGTGRFIKKLLQELAKKSSVLRGRVVKIVGVDLSKENVHAVHAVCKAAVEEKRRLRCIAFEGYARGVDDLDSLRINPVENLVCITSGGLTRHVMPFQTAYQAFEIMQRKNCQLFIGGGLEPVWMNSRIAKQLGFKFEAIGPFESKEFGEKRLILLEPLLPSSTVPSLPNRVEPALIVDGEVEEGGKVALRGEESGYIEKAFSSAFLFRVHTGSSSVGRASSVSMSPGS